MAFRWTWEMMEALLKEYSKWENLYNPNHRDYLDRVKRQKAYETVASKLRRFNDKTTAGHVRVKFQTVRSQFAREVRLVKKSKKSGASSKDIYVPKLWCYNHLKFLMPYCAVKTPLTPSELGGDDSPSCSEPEYERNQPSTSKGRRRTTLKHERVNSADKRRTRRDYRSNSEDIADPLVEYLDNHENIDCQDKNSTKRDYRSNFEDKTHPLLENHEHFNSSDQKSIRGPNSEDRGDTFVGNVHNVESQRDDYQIFGDYIASEFRSLRYDHNRRLLRLKIQRAILDVADIDNRDANAKVSNLVNLLPSSTSIQLKEGHQDSENQEQLICIAGIWDNDVSINK